MLLAFKTQYLHSRNKNIERTSADDKISKAHFDEPKMIYTIRGKGNAGWPAVHNCTVHTDHRLYLRLSRWRYALAVAFGAELDGTVTAGCSNRRTDSLIYGFTYRRHH